MQGRNVAIAGRRQGDEAEVDKVACDSEIAVKRRQIGECTRNGQSDETEQSDKYQPDGEIKKDRAHDAVISDPTTPEHGPRHYDAQRQTRDQPCGRVEIKIDA